MKTRRLIPILEAISVVLMVVTAVGGLFFSGIYRDFISPLHLAESQGQDAVTLFLAVPLMVLSFLFYKKRRLFSLLSGAGASGYTLYVYLIYVFGGVYNPLYFCYTALCSLSIFLLILIFSDNGFSSLKLPESRGFPTPLALFFLFTALMLTVMWGVMGYQGMKDGAAPDGFIIIAIDFIIIIPAYILAAAGLWRRAGGSVSLSAVLLVQALTLGFSIVAGQVMAWIKGVEPAMALGLFFLGFTVLAAGFSIVYERLWSGELRRS